MGLARLWQAQPASPQAEGQLGDEAASTSTACSEQEEVRPHPFGSGGKQACPVEKAG